MTIDEASRRYNIPLEILQEYEQWGLCGAVKKVMGAWQYDDTDLERLSTIMTLHDIGFTTEEVETYMRLLGRDYRAKEDFTVETVPGFQGSTYSESALWLTPGEDIQLWHGSSNITVTNGENDQPHQGVFYKERLEEVDKYTVFLDGNHSTVRIVNPDAKEKGKLLVIRDSYSNCLGTLLAESYEEVVLVDLRYYKNPVSQLCAEENFTDVLVCYSMDNIMTDTNLVWLQ